MGLITRNAEGHRSFDLVDRHWHDRRPGYSAMVRLKNEAEWIAHSLLSIAEVFDEIDCFIQPSTDGTFEIVRALKLPNVRIFEYPFDSMPNGPGYKQQDASSIHSRTFFYNWCLSKTRHRWVTKWDGDMVAQDWYGDFRTLTETADVIFERGVDIVGPALRHVGRRKFTASEPRHFRVTRQTYYVNGQNCEVFRVPRRRGRLRMQRTRKVTISKPTYLHFKWAKSLASQSKAWPDNWEGTEHFGKLAERAEAVDIYDGPYPSILKVQSKVEATR